MSGKALQQSEVLMPDGSSFFSDEHGQTMHLTYIECDSCGREIPARERWNLWAWAPGSQYWAQVMWLCVTCGIEMRGLPNGVEPGWGTDDE